MIYSKFHRKFDTQNKLNCLIINIFQNYIQNFIHKQIKLLDYYYFSKLHTKFDTQNKLFFFIFPKLHTKFGTQNELNYFINIFQNYIQNLIHKRNEIVLLLLFFKIIYKIWYTKQIKLYIYFLIFSKIIYKIWYTNQIKLF